MTNKQEILHRITIHRILVRDACLGFLFGFVVLHPVSMLIFRWLDQDFSGAMGEMHGQGLWGPILDSFYLPMFSMGLAYGLLCSLVAVMNSYNQSTIRKQKDLLSLQLDQNELYQAELKEKAELLKNQNEQLIKLERSNRRTTRFMVHDFKTHIGCILGFTDLLLTKSNESQGGRTIKALQRIRRQAHQMMNEISDLLDYARLQETGRLRREELSVADLLTQAANDFSLPEHEAQISIGKKARDCSTIWADHRLLRRILTNLISNALKHNAPGTRVLIDADYKQKQFSILFSIRDDGEGVPVEMRPVIFSDFSSNAKGDETSSGLGLAFCKEAVEEHGGRIWCESRDGVGSCFYFTLPDRKESRDEQGS